MAATAALKRSNSVKSGMDMSDSSGFGSPSMTAMAAFAASITIDVDAAMYRWLKIVWSATLRKWECGISCCFYFHAFVWKEISVPITSRVEK